MASPGSSNARLTVMFADDGTIPNNPLLPVLIYRGAIALDGANDPAEAVEETFRRNGWGHDMWRDGIFDYVHYHSMIHEALGIVHGRATVRLGGGNGRIFDIEAGDVIVLPAGTGHQCLSSDDDFLIVGAYPAGGQYDLCRNSKDDHDRAVASIPQVPLPESDPVGGPNGPLTRLWQAEYRA